jgi:hypothetical protein
LKPGLRLRLACLVYSNKPATRNPKQTARNKNTTTTTKHEAKRRKRAAKEEATGARTKARHKLNFDNIL